MLRISKWETSGDAAELLEAVREQDDVGFLCQRYVRLARLFAVQNHVLWIEENNRRKWAGFDQIIERVLLWIDTTAWIGTPSARMPAWCHEMPAVVESPLPFWTLTDAKRGGNVALDSARACRNDATADLVRCIYEPLYQGTRFCQLTAGLHSLPDEAVRIAVSAYRDRDWNALPALADWLEKHFPDVHPEVVCHLRGNDRECSNCHWSWDRIRVPTGDCPVCDGTKSCRTSRVHGRGCWVLEAILYPH